MRSIITARFWAYVNEGFVRLSLKDGESIEHTTGGLADEGHGYESTKWERDGEIITRHYIAWGADCDGRYERHSTDTAHIEELERVEHYPPIQDWLQLDRPEDWPIVCLTPNWESGERGQRDYSAEAAGF